MRNARSEMGDEESGTMRNERYEMSRGGEAIGFVIVGRIGCGAVAATMQRDATRVGKSATFESGGR